LARDLSTPMIAPLTSAFIRPGFLADISFRSEQQYVWTGIGNLLYNGNTYRGVGSLGKVGDVSESSDVNAEGTSISLSGIDPALLSECMSDIQLGAPVTIWFALFDVNCNIIGTPYPYFVGTVDQPVLQIGVDALTISLKLENRLVNLQRANMRRYTSADQDIYYPGDTAFNWVEILNDQALLWAP
jgi:hypothetical protein